MTRSGPPPLAVPGAGAVEEGGVDGPDAVERQRAQRLLLALAQLGAVATRALHARVDPRFSSNVEVLVLTRLDLSGPQRPADIVALTGMTSSGVTKVLDRLEAHGLIARGYGRIEGDRRGTQLELTAEGERVAAQLAAGLASEMDTVRAAIEEVRSVAGD